MNFIKCQVESYKPLKIVCNNITLSPESKGKPQGDSVIIGIRPEDISVSNMRTEDSIEIVVSVIEPAGSFNWVDFMWNEVKMKGTGKAEEELKPGDKAFINFSADKVIAFDYITSRRL